jgi:hypothetical protein
MRLMARITCEPAHSLFDSLLNIQIAGARPKQPLTISSHVKHASGDYISFAHYLSGENGNIDLKTMPSVGGMYTGWCLSSASLI